MSFKIGICDDCVEDILTLSEALYELDSSFEISTYASGTALIDELNESDLLIDILFLDIYMPGINGIKTAQKIRAKMEELKIIFVSSSKDYYPEAYDVFAFNYMLKPIDTEKLKLVMDKALRHISNEKDAQISFNYKTKNHRIFCKDIRYIESRNKIIIFHMFNKTTLECYSKMDEIIKLIPQEMFIRCHQSYAVNIKYVSEMTDSYFGLNDTTISISKKYLKSAKEKYFEYLFLHMNIRGI